MKVRIAMSLFAAALAAIPGVSRAEDGVRWESLNVYALPGGRAVAVAVPAEWQRVGAGPRVDSGLRFVDPTGAEIVISKAALERAAGARRVFRPEPAGKVSLASRSVR